MLKINNFSKSLLVIVFISIFISVLFYAFSKKYPFLRYFFESNPPQLTLLKVPKGLGNKTQEFKIYVEDNESGLELVRIRAEQGNSIFPIYNSDFNFKTFSKEINFEIDSKNLGLKKGNVNLIIEAYDRSLNSNGLRHVLELPISFDAPVIEVLSSQHNTVRTGMEMVIFRVKSDTISETGIQLDKYRFKAYPAELFDDSLQGISDLYIGLFVVPRDYDDTKKPFIYAYNEVGNRSTKNFYYRIRETKQKIHNFNIIDDNKFFDYLEQIKSELSKLQYNEKRQWADQFVRPIGIEQALRVGDKVSLSNEKNKDTTFITNNFLFYYTAMGERIRNINNGKIIKMSIGEDDSSGYIFIDHGFGFISVYAAISEISPLKEEFVPQGSYIAKHGFLPFLQKNGYIMGLFYQGVPVNPQEWFDPTWTNDHIVAKIRELKVRFNIQEVIPEVKKNELQGEIITDREISGSSKSLYGDVPKPVIRKDKSYHQDLDF